ncbi:MAG TPA: hypothetical protein VFI54_15500 [Solirubrobacteraceae bacterium]|nr:hypothetical protein [Solirubrobacteraceae bacterium]
MGAVSAAFPVPVGPADLRDKSLNERRARRLRPLADGQRVDEQDDVVRAGRARDGRGAPGQLLPEPVQANRVGQVVAQWPAERIDLLLEHRLADASAGVREALQSVFDGVTPRRELPDGQVITTLDRDGGQLPMQIHVVGLKSGQE